VFSVELAAANAEIARRIWAHAGVDDRITCVVGTIGDGGKTLDALAAQHGFSEGSLDFMFVDPRGKTQVHCLTALLIVPTFVF
jgi:catechol O-methyltransferase